MLQLQRPPRRFQRLLELRDVAIESDARFGTYPLVLFSAEDFEYRQGTSARAFCVDVARKATLRRPARSMEELQPSRSKSGMTGLGLYPKPAS